MSNRALQFSEESFNLKCGDLTPIPILSPYLKGSEPLTFKESGYIMALSTKENSYEKGKICNSLVFLKLFPFL